MSSDETPSAEDEYFCGYCGHGSLFDRHLKYKPGELESQVPCPVCCGTGRKDHSKCFKRCEGPAQVVKVGDVFLDPEDCSPHRRVTVTFILNYPAQDDGHLPHRDWVVSNAANAIGKVIAETLEKEKLL